MIATSVTSDRSREFRAIGLVSIELILTLFVIQKFQIESRTFFQVMVLGAAGFVVHALLPLPYRMAFFGFVSLASVILALGPRDGVSLILLGLVLIGISHLPVLLMFRVVLLAATAALFAIWRMEWLPAPWSVAIWPILASMFMFRLALYVYTLKHDKRRPTIAQTLAYFFMLPNVCFPLYPVVDYSTFIRTYYDRDAAQIYTTGMRWIVRGLIHLILYRFVYLYLVGDPSNVASLFDLVQFMLATFLLYLRVSGQFHLIAGVLHLYGFRLPETHHLYYLASSFSDFWRRINIYWKDFMMKLVYYPSYFKLRRGGANFGMVTSTIIVFAATWMLHSYQWFWLRGGFPFTLQDGLFWAILGTLVVFGSLREMQRSSKRKLRRSSGWNAGLALRRLGTFSVICVLWSLWSSDSVTTWLTMLGAASNTSLRDVALLTVLVTAAAVIAGREWSVRGADDNIVMPLHRRPELQCIVLLLGVLAIGETSLYARYAPKLAATIASMQKSTLNVSDAALLHKGYYENLDNSSRMTAQLWDIRAKKPSHWVSLASTEAYRKRTDFMLDDLRPGVHISFEDQPFTTNRWGMRDRDRSLAKPEGTYRIALLGPSHIMGSGVADDQTIAVYLEERLNQSTGPGPHQRYEVLNFGVAAYSLTQQLAMLEDRVVGFQPDAVLITDSPGLYGPVLDHLETLILSRVSIPYAGLNDLVHQAGIESLGNSGYPVPFENARAILRAVGIETRMPGREAHRHLSLFRDNLVRWTLSRIAAVTREHGAAPVFVALNVVSDPDSNELAAITDAKEAGFLVFNLLDVWKNRDKSALRIAEWDEHPNAAGNQLVAERLMELMSEHRAELQLGTDNQRASATKSNLRK